MQIETFWPHLISHGLPALGYFLISLLLIRIISIRADITSYSIFTVLALFAFICGLLELMEVIVIWTPIGRTEEVLKLARAIVSLSIVFMLAKGFSRFSKIPSSTQLKELNNQLKKEIKHRTKNEFDLQQSEKKFRLAMFDAPIGKALVGLDGSWLEVNGAICKMLGYTRTEFLQMDFQAITHPENLNQDLQNVNNLIDGKIDTYEMEKRYIHKEGHYIWGLLSVSLVRDKNNEPLYFISQIVDIQRIKEAEKKILHFNQELEQKVEVRTSELKELNEEMESFVYTVTHDLRLPLKNLTGLTSLLKMDYDEKIDENGQYILRLLTENVDKMDTLITDLLGFSRVKNIELEKDHFDIGLMIENTIEELAPNFAEKNISYKIGELPSAYGDKKTIRQVCYNLLSNALKYASKQEKILLEIGATADDDQHTYWIKDNGVGFDDKQEEKLFAIFKRLHSPKDFEGTGVGLAMTKRILTKHGGKIWARSKVGQGATFYFSLPTVKEDILA